MTKDANRLRIRELQEAIMAEDRRVQEAVDCARRAVASHRDIAEAAEESARLAAIARYSTCIAKRVREAATAAGRERECRDLQGHLQTLRVLGDVLRLTAPHPVD